MAPAPAKPGRALFRIWRCEGCDRVLGRIEGDEVVWEHGEEQMTATLPARRYCRRCKAWRQVA